jgi:hypothetical protein
MFLVLAVVLLLPPTTNAFGGSFKYDGVNGSLTIANGTQTATVRVNATGWAVWNYSSQQVNETVFKVLGVNFNYIDSTTSKSYTITSFLQEAPVLDTIWDRVNITIKIPRSRIDVSSNAYPSLDAVYAFQRRTLQRFNDPDPHLLRWSKPKQRGG